MVSQPGGRRGMAEVVRRGVWCPDPPAGHDPRGSLRAIVVHHTGRAAGALADRGAEVAYARGIWQLHVDRGWTDIGYHFLVMPSGRIFIGRPAWALGAHVLDHNRGTLGVALAGDFEVEHPAAAALASIGSIRGLVLGARRVPLLTHRDLAAVSCPGENLYRAVSGLRPDGEAGARAVAPDAWAAAAGSGRR